ncbi:extracellular solute-binding protein [Paenibacillus mesophilus]|uniref:extracellular solute-binding protein n=1 Tax=Paenibacillus mesophilus TaxID=2582849 RepID=UPI00110F505E|nr:extracellular solute-binding protein [Paenibacillus mesophilus]TMV48748.1 extracellular solute-binding protein [Paenibacillus mesophilus]
MRRRPSKEQFGHQLERVAKELRDEMIAGKWACGSFLPPEKSLETRFRLSNYSIRLGLEQLVKEGWIEKIPGVGNRVVADRPPVKLTAACNNVTLRNLKLPGLLEQFRRLHPWISVELRISSGSVPGIDLSERMLEDDLVLMDNVQFQQLSELHMTHVFEPLTGKWDLYPQFSKHFSTEDRLLLLPIVLSPLVLCYNKAHFRDSGLAEPNGSWTWNDLIRHAEQLNDGKGRYGFAFHIQSMYRWPLFLMQSGERFEWNGAKLRDIRGSRLLEGLKLCKEMLHNRKAVPLYLSENNDDIDRLFMEGKLSMTLNTYMGLNGWNAKEIEYDISPVPYMDSLKTLLITLGVGVSSSSRHKEEAKLFADFLASSEAQAYIHQHTLSIPGLATLPLTSGERTIYSPVRYMLFRETMGSYRTHADMNISSAAFISLANLLKPYWANMIDEDELCERLSEALSI